MIPRDAAFGIQERVNGPVEEQAHQGGGVGAIVTVAIWARIFPVLRTTRTFDPPEELLDSPPEEKLQEQMP